MKDRLTELNPTMKKIRQLEELAMDLGITIEMQCDMVFITDEKGNEYEY